jgi:hypothetical protein
MRKSVLLIATITAAVAMTEAAMATEKRDHWGCTLAQLQSPKGKQCIDKNLGPGGISAGVAYVLYCSSTGKLLCCEANDNGTLKDHSCSVLQDGLRRPQGISAPSGGAVAPEGRGRGPFSAPGGSILDPATGGSPTGPAGIGNPLGTSSPVKSTPAPSFH